MDEPGPEAGGGKLDEGEIARGRGVFEAALAALAGSGVAEERVRMIDATAVRAHRHATGANGGRDGQALGRSRGGFSTGLHLRCDANGLPLAIVLTPGQTHEMLAFDLLVEDMAPGTRRPVGDVGHDADRARQELLLRGVPPVIPSNPARKEPLPLDRELYQPVGEIGSG